MQEITNQILQKFLELTKFTERHQYMNNGEKSHTINGKEMGGTIGSYMYDLGKKLITFQLQEKFELIIIQLNDYIPNFSEFLDLSKYSEDDDTPLEWRQLIKQIKHLYQDWYDHQYIDLINSYKKYQLFSEHEIEQFDQWNPTIHLNVELALNQKLFKLYQYRKGSGILTSITKWNLYPTIGMSEDIQQWLDFVKHQPMSNIPEDQAVVSVFYKIDRLEPHYSYFLIVIQIQDSIWITTDQLDFHNPRNKRSRRKPERNRENHYEQVYLPYDLVEEILNTSGLTIPTETYEIFWRHPDWRPREGGGFQRSVPKEEPEDYCDQMILEQGLEKLRKLGYRNIVADQISNSFNKIYLLKEYGKIIGHYKTHNDGGTIKMIPRVFSQIPITSINTYEKVFLIGLISEMIARLSDQDSELLQINSAQEILNQKLIGNEKFDPTDITDFLYKDSVKHETIELFETLNKEFQTTALAIQEFTPVETSRYYDRDWIGTPKSLDNLLKWTVLENQADQLRPKLRLLEQQKDQDTKKLRELLKTSWKSVYTEIFTGSKYYLTDFAESFGTRNTRTLLPYAIHLDPDHYYDPEKSSSIKWSSEQIKLWNDWTYLGGSTEGVYCNDCDQSPLVRKSYATLQISHYSQLMKILNCTREELPAYWRNYRTGQLQSYRGNSILDNVHPYALLKDPASQRFKAGLDLTLYVCKNCYKKHCKSYNFDYQEYLNKGKKILEDFNTTKI